MYIAAVRIADTFGCNAIGIQCQQGLKDVLPASDLSEGLLNIPSGRRYFIMPKFQIAFDVKPGDVLLANVHELHGNAAMSGLRVSCVYRAREKMHLCGKEKGVA